MITTAHDTPGPGDGRTADGTTTPPSQPTPHPLHRPRHRAWGQRAGGAKQASWRSYASLCILPLFVFGIITLTGCNKYTEAAKEGFKELVAEADDAINDNDDETQADPSDPTALPDGVTKAEFTTDFFKKYEGIQIGGSADDIEDATVKVSTGDVLKPAVKYLLTDDNTLQIHLWLAYVSYDTPDAAPKDIDKDSALATEYRAGVKDYWSITVESDVYSYTTEVHFHNGTKADLERAASDRSAQQYVAVCIGGECPAYAPGECPESVSGNHWYHAHPQGPVGYPGTPSVMYLPTTTQTESNKTAQKRTHLTGKNFGAACAHETGHIFGLADAYPAEDAKGVRDRMDENDETAVETHGVWCNLMKDQNSVKQVLPNDLQMILKAYSVQVTDYTDDFLQNYKTYTWYDSASGHTKYKVSGAISDTSDNHND
ncbi:MAG: hypothetical protein LBS17_07065 [Actinomycetes bacterium]|jgi:hypothetical protein|nr:hypothetical protein [Actinomycetes bacterium]